MLTLHGVFIPCFGIDNTAGKQQDNQLLLICNPRQGLDGMGDYNKKRRDNRASTSETCNL